MEREVREEAKMFDTTAQIWTILEEYEKVQQLDKQEEKINASIQDLRKR
jgi:hypothetical protein